MRSQRGPRLDLLPTGTEFQVRRLGEDSRFSGSRLRVPANVLRDRPGDILDAASLARRHRPYHWRLVIGPTYRADLWAGIEQNATATPYALASATGASYATAWTTRNDFLLRADARWAPPPNRGYDPAVTVSDFGPLMGQVFSTLWTTGVWPPTSDD